MRLLLISNSTNVGEGYLEYPKNNIKEFLGDIDEVLFFPYAGVTVAFDDYEKKVSDRLAEVDVKVKSAHKCDNILEAIENAKAIVVGGGNTFQLLNLMYENNVIEAIQNKVKSGTPYIGWSAGSNLTCPTIRTTNDMPIIEPKSFKALNLIPFQINPHYLDAHPDGHGGETREQRLEEFQVLNPDMYVAGLREGCMFLVENGTIKHIGSRSCRIFKYNTKPYELESSDDFNFLIK